MTIFKTRQKKKTPIHPRPKRIHRRWLLWTALFILLVGGGITYIIHLDRTLVGREQYMLFSIIFTVILSGISFISAAADWFIER